MGEQVQYRKGEKYQQVCRGFEGGPIDGNYLQRKHQRGKERNSLYAPHICVFTSHLQLGSWRIIISFNLILKFKDQTHRVRELEGSRKKQSEMLR